MIKFFVKAEHTSANKLSKITRKQGHQCFVHKISQTPIINSKIIIIMTCKC